jgi:hypothetical protein
MGDLAGLRGTPQGRLLLTLSGIGGGAAFGVLFSVVALVAHWPGAWGLPDHEVARLLFLVGVGGGVFLGAAVGVGLAGNLGSVGFLGMVPALVIVAYEYLAMDMGLPRGTYFLVTAPALSVLMACLLALVPVLKGKSQDGGGSWWWRATWARILGRPLPPLPASMLPRHDPGSETSAVEESRG